MIFLEKSGVREEDFLVLLEKSRLLLIDFVRDRKNISPLDFETIVYEQMCEAAKATDFEGKVRQTGAHAFPDIVVNKFYGVEVKMTTGDHWTSTGNSVLESSRIEDVERIYIMFGKFGGKFDVRYRLYQECLPDVSVTHSPRYRINMDLPSGKSVFDKMGIEYDVLRKDPNPIRKIKEYYKAQLKDGEELWWIDQNGEDKAVSPIIRPFRRLGKNEQEDFILDVMILFPEIFGNSPSKYERPAAYLITRYNAVSASLRDLFTAGGKMKIKVKNKTLYVPKMVYNLKIRAKEISLKINNFDKNVLMDYWRTGEQIADPIAGWKKMINKPVEPKSKIKISDVFDSGLL
jgi:hypothetical protein